MTRSWQFTLADDTLFYNLWTLITEDSSFTDPTFETAQFVPSQVCQLFVYPITHNTAIALYNTEIFTTLIAGTSPPCIIGPFDNNIIQLNGFSFRGSASSTVVGVAIVSK